MMPPTNNRMAIDLNALARDAGFPESFDLALNAQNALEAFRQVRHLELLDQGVRAKRQSLRRLEKHSQAVAHELEQLGPDVLHDLADWTDPDLPVAAVEALHSYMKSLSDAAGNMVSDVPAAPIGRPAEAGLEFAIRELYSIFRDHFPGEVGFYRKDEAEHGYDGKFYHLVRLLLARLGIEKSPFGVGKAIARALKGRTRVPAPRGHK